MDIPKQIQEIHKILFLIGFKFPTNNFYNFGNVNYCNYKDWNVSIEHKLHDSVRQTIRFELFPNNMGGLNDKRYVEIRKSLYHGFQNIYMDEYEKDFNEFKEECLKIFFEKFKNELRPYKIERLLN